MATLLSLVLHLLSKQLQKHSRIIEQWQAKQEGILLLHPFKCYFVKLVHCVLTSVKDLFHHIRCKFARFSFQYHCLKAFLTGKHF